jgi:hypothetical protein
MAIQQAGARVREIQLPPRSRHSHVTKSALFADLSFAVQRPPVRQDTFLDAGDKDDVKFRPFGGMERHQGYTLRLGRGSGMNANTLQKVPEGESPELEIHGQRL